MLAANYLLQFQLNQYQQMWRVMYIYIMLARTKEWKMLDKVVKLKLISGSINEKLGQEMVSTWNGGLLLEQ